MIRIDEVVVIDETGKYLGAMPTADALVLANEKGLDLLEVAPNGKPPVCKIIDHGKYKYKQRKKSQEAKKKQKTIQIKEIKLRPKTEEHDYQFKKRHAEAFLEKHYKVKFTMVFRGRELNHKELGEKVLNRISEELSHVGSVEKPPQFEGRFMMMIMTIYFYI